MAASTSFENRNQSGVDVALRNVEGRYQTFVEAALDEIYVFSRDGRIQYLNRAAAARLHRAASDVIGQRVQNLISAGPPAATWEDVQRVLDARTPIYTEREFTLPDRTTFWQSIWLIPLAQDQGDIDSILSIARDITARKRAESELLESRERFKLIAETIDEVFWIADAERRTFFYVSPSYERIWGRTLQSLYDCPTSFVEAIHPDDRPQAVAALREQQGAGRLFNQEYRIVHPDGTVKWIWDRGFPGPAGQGRESRYVGIALDVTARKLAEERLQHDALFDRLTRLPNRALLMDRLQQAAMRVTRNPQACFALLFIDLDNFKAINDNWGHEVGDQLLVAMAARLQSCLRPDDTLARLGGDEFVILTGDVKVPDDASHLADRILRELRQPFAPAGHEVFITASIGIAPGSGNAESCANLLRNADMAMYRAKRHGKAHYRTFSDDMHADAVRGMQLEADLRNGLSNHQFTLLYQPIVNVKRGRITRVEALLRWQHPIQGQLEPARFLPVAEELGLMVPIGAWVLRTACADALAWRDAGLIERVAVNFSPSEFGDPGFVSGVEAALRETGLDPRALELELSERIIFGSDPSTVSELRRLINLGASLSIEYFGAAHSSLRWLVTFPIATLKIDRSFLRHVLTDATGARVMKALIVLGHSLDLKVAAEGVETEGQQRFLEAANCDEMQGFYIGGLLTADQVGPLLLAQGVDPGRPDTPA